LKLKIKHYGSSNKKEEGNYRQSDEKIRAESSEIKHCFVLQKKTIQKQKKINPKKETGRFVAGKNQGQT